MTIGKNLEVLLENYEGYDVEKYIRNVYHIYNSYTDNLQNIGLIDIDVRNKSIKYLQNLNEYKREILNGLTDITSFVELFDDSDNSRYNTINSIDISHVVLDITDRYLIVSQMFLDRQKEEFTFQK